MITVQTAAALGLLVASYITIFSLLRRSQFDLRSLSRGEVIGLAFNGAVAVAALGYVAYIQLSPQVLPVSNIGLNIPQPSRVIPLPLDATATIDPRLIGVLYSSNREFEDSEVGKIDRGAITSRRSPNPCMALRSSEFPRLTFT